VNLTDVSAQNGAERMTQLIRIDASKPQSDALCRAADVIRKGGLVAFPTETVYGLGASALDSAAVGRIFEAKGRPAGNPLIVHVAGDEMLPRVVAEWPSNARKLAQQFWPGPLTLVLPKADGVPDIVTARGATVAVRMPAHPVALGLIRECGLPLAAPSANRSSQLSPTRAEHVMTGLKGRIDLILDAGPTPSGIESTVLDLTTDPPTLLRPGPVSVQQLEEVIGPIRRAPEPSSSLRSPGMMPRHYAPRTPLELFDDRAALNQRATELQQIGEKFGEVTFEDGPMPTDPGGYAARLYDVLHELDERGFDRILVELPPDTAEWFAVRDRLQRAAG
jgi:L-threonylcarbamoyladenylate synthase